MRRRLDAELVRRGLAPSRVVAKALIEAGSVTVSGVVADKASRQVDAGEPLLVAGPGRRFVSRGGEKLDAALDHFGIDVVGRACVDVGASTGGFTDCLLQRGATGVVAIDVGRNQLHESLRRDPRVVSRERLHVRDAEPDALGGPWPMLVADLSFISLTRVVAPLLRLVAPAADLVLLVKPQFEAERRDVSRGRGVVTDPDVWRDAVERVGGAFGDAGATNMGAMVSPIHGSEGNTEFLLHLRGPADR